jgi:hypothetical protein
VCTAYRRLVSGPGPCSRCGSGTASLLDVRVAIGSWALIRSAIVEALSGEAAILLLTHEALRRESPPFGSLMCSRRTATDGGRSTIVGLRERSQILAA